MKIAFTSCMRIETFPQQAVWKLIAKEQPDYLFLLGDQIYMDFFPDLGEPANWNDSQFQAVMLSKYQAQWAEPNFKALFSHLNQRRGNGGGVFGTWDDHDFAWNNACGAEVPATKQAISRKLFTEFMQCNPDPDKLYYSILLKHNNKVIGTAIFLDTRSYREKPGDDRDLLGEKQFQFLQQEINHPYPLTLLCAGTPMRATGNGWMRYRRDYERFRKIVGDRRALFLSGDIHENAFLPPSSQTNLYEIIASGAAVKKFWLKGKRQNYGILDWSPGQIKIKLVDLRGTQSFTIHNADFSYDEDD